VLTQESDCLVNSGFCSGATVERQDVNDFDGTGQRCSQRKKKLIELGGVQISQLLDDRLFFLFRKRVKRIAFPSQRGVGSGFIEMCIDANGRKSLTTDS
jgi:hypothetical protein